MNLRWGLLWALALALALTPFSKADVCQKGAPSHRIKMITQDDGSVTFESCLGKQPCKPFGPTGTSFTREELSKKYDDLDSSRAGGKGGSAAGDFLGLFLLVTGNVKLAGNSFDEGDKHLHKAEVMKAKMKVIEAKLLTSEEACTDVPSLANHKSILSGVLSEIVKDRSKVETVSTAKQEDGSDAKRLPDVAHSDNPKSVAAVKTETSKSVR